MGSIPKWGNLSQYVFFIIYNNGQRLAFHVTFQMFTHPLLSNGICLFDQSEVEYA